MLGSLQNALSWSGEKALHCPSSAARVWDGCSAGLGRGQSSAGPQERSCGGKSHDQSPEIPVQGMSSERPRKGLGSGSQEWKTHRLRVRAALRSAGFSSSTFPEDCWRNTKFCLIQALKGPEPDFVRNPHRHPALRWDGGRTQPWGHGGLGDTGTSARCAQHQHVPGRGAQHGAQLQARVPECHPRAVLHPHGRSGLWGHAEPHSAADF